MLTHRPWIYSVPQSGIISLVCLMVIIPLYATFVGCTGEGVGDSVNSGLSTSAGVITDPSLEQSTGPTDAATDFISNRTSEPLSINDLSSGADSPEHVPMISMTSTPSGATVRLNWLHSSDADSFGYHVYYGK